MFRAAGWIRLLVLPLIATAAALSPIAASDAAPRPRLSMTCHEMLGGVPMRQPTTYQVVGRDFFRASSLGERVRISAEGRRLPLGVTRDRQGAMNSFASHTLNGRILTRRLYWQRPGRPMRLVRTERFDFGVGRYTDSSDPGDHCRRHG